MKVLLHICCGTCALYPFPTLQNRGMEVVGFWFNPNIHPLAEYRARLASLRKVWDVLGFELLEQDAYGLVEFVRAVAGKEQERCAYCYRTRLEETAREAAARGFDAFSTTLLISPYQNQALLGDIGRECAARHGVEFHFEDFREGFRQAQQKATELELYRQKYCGCVYSEMEGQLRAKRGNIALWKPRDTGAP